MRVGEALPAGDRVACRPAEHLVGREARDRLGGGVPEADRPGLVDEADAVGDVGEHARRVGGLLDLARQPRVVDRERRHAGEILSGGEVVGAVGAARCAREQREGPERPPPGAQRDAHPRLRELGLAALGNLEDLGLR